MDSSPLLRADALTTSSSIEDLRPLQRFRLLREPDYGSRERLEYYLGLERGDLQHCWEPRNLILVRADVIQLLYKKEFALVPTQNALDVMFDLVLFNSGCNAEDRKSCFDRLPHEECEYWLVPLSAKEGQPFPLYMLNDDGTKPQRIDCAWPQLPRVKLDMHPIYAMIYSKDEVIWRNFKQFPFYKLILQLGALFSLIPPHDFPAPHVTATSSQETASVSNSSDSGSSMNVADSAFTVALSELEVDTEPQRHKIDSWLSSTETEVWSEVLDPDQLQIYGQDDSRLFVIS